MEKKSDPVNHPNHYNAGKIEVIEGIEDWMLGFHLGNAVKYVARAGKKDSAKTIEDLEKAVWYIKREIALLKGNAPRPNEMNKGEGREWILRRQAVGGGVYVTAAFGGTRLTDDDEVRVREILS